MMSPSGPPGVQLSHKIFFSTAIFTNCIQRSYSSRMPWFRLFTRDRDLRRVSNSSLWGFICMSQPAKIRQSYRQLNHSIAKTMERFMT